MKRHSRILLAFGAALAGMCVAAVAIAAGGSAKGTLTYKARGAPMMTQELKAAR